MKVFISWSGTLSKQLAESLNGWIPTVIQSIETYFTPENIDKGARWFPEISDELEKTDYGILCVTKENLNSPWMIFEAGALSKQVKKSRVCPILFDVATSDLPPVLGQFQAVTKFEKGQVKELMESLNKLIKKPEKPLATEVFNRIFDRSWPEIEGEVEKTLKDYDYGKNLEESRTSEDIIKEILGLTRSMASSLAMTEFHLSNINKVGVGNLAEVLGRSELAKKYTEWKIGGEK